MEANENLLVVENDSAVSTIAQQTSAELINEKPYSLKRLPLRAVFPGFYRFLRRMGFGDKSEDPNQALIDFYLQQQIKDQQEEESLNKALEKLGN